MPRKQTVKDYLCTSEFEGKVVKTLYLDTSEIDITFTDGSRIHGETVSEWEYTFDGESERQVEVDRMKYWGALNSEDKLKELL